VRERREQCSWIGTSRRYSTRQASGRADGGEPAIRQVWGMTLAGSRVIGGPPERDKAHSRGHTLALERRLRARDRNDKSRLRCIVQAPAQARLRGHAGDSLSGRSTLLKLKACDAPRPQHAGSSTVIRPRLSPPANWPATRSALWYPSAALPSHQHSSGTPHASPPRTPECADEATLPVLPVAMSRRCG
jgi:hypothetical protein